MRNSSLLDNLDLDDEKPYSSVSDRDPLEQVNPVMEAIKRRKLGGGSIPLSPEMIDYDLREKDFEEGRKAKNESDLFSNLGQSFSQLSRGTATPTGNDALFANIQKQGAANEAADEASMDRRQKVLTAIEARKARAAESALKHEDLKIKREDIRSRDRTTAAQKESINKDILHLPAEDQEVVKDLAKKNASKIAIANQIEAVMGRWEDLPADQKVAQGRQLLKVLNSTEGADAVGAEEAKRLGGKLEFAMGNFTNSNPVQFGRDLAGFKEQALGTAGAIRDAIRANENEINKRYSKGGVPRAAESTSPAKKKMTLADETTTGMVRMRAPDGTTRMIPKDHVQSAIKAGGEVF